MSIDNANGVEHVTRAQWDALREQCKRVLTESAEICDHAIQARSDAIEQRLISPRVDHLEHDAAVVAGLVH